MILSVSIMAMSKNSVHFTGNAPEYSGLHIEFNKISNYFFNEASTVAVMQIADDGSFDFSFEIDEITYIFAELGRFKTYIYVEPGVTYNLIFPPFEQKTESQKLSPHFHPEEIPFGIKNKEAQDLNKNIVLFNEEFEYQYNKNARNTFIVSNNEIVKEIETSLENQFTFSHPYFVKHKQISYLKLQQLSQRMKERYLLGKLSEFDIEYEMPVYWEVFKGFITGFLPQKFSPSKKEEKLESEVSLSHAINTNMRFDTISAILMSDNIFKNNKFAEISLLYTLFESFYNNSIGKTVCVEIIQSAINYASTEKNKKIAADLFKKITMLRPGSPAPDFALYNKKEKLRELKDYSGKFLYLSFIHTKNHACLLDLQTIETLEKIFKKDLECVTVIIDDDVDIMLDFLKKNPQYKWDFLHFGLNGKILEDYNIKIVPTYYLIDPKGILNLSPAPAPRENFQNIFVDRLQQYKREDIRKNPPKEKSVFDW